MGKKPQVVSWYDEIVQQKTPKRPLAKNCLKAFSFGGLLCALAQLAHYILVTYGQVADTTANSIVVTSVIILAGLFTGIGIYDKVAQKVGAGLAVPITGFANSVVAAAMEHKSEGYVLGSGCNSFKLAGAVVLFGIASAGLVAIIELILGLV